MKRAALMALLVSCRTPPAAEAKPVAVDSPPAASVTAPPLVASEAGAAEPERAAGLEPLPGATLETWHADGFDVAASLPVGARAPRPVVVGIHGSKDSHTATCARWRRAFAGFAFIVCPQGVPYRGGLAWGSPAIMAERIDRALALLEERHGAYVAKGPVVYAGWSLGATRGPGVIALRPGVFEPVVLAEIGHTRIDANATVNSFKKGRAGHPLIACATNRCAQFVKRLQRASNLSKPQGPPVGYLDAGIGRGHLFDDTMAKQIGSGVARVVASDPRWSGFEAALAASPEDAGAPDEEVAGDEDDEP
jgi:hypothetical protein